MSESLQERVRAAVLAVLPTDHDWPRQRVEAVAANVADRVVGPVLSAPDGPGVWCIERPDEEGGHLVTRISQGEWNWRGASAVPKGRCYRLYLPEFPPVDDELERAWEIVRRHGYTPAKITRTPVVRTGCYVLAAFRDKTCVEFDLYGAFDSEEDAREAGNQIFDEATKWTIFAVKQAVPLPDQKTIADDADTRLGTATYLASKCAGCGKELLRENAWMTDGCPCNSGSGINDGNLYRWRLLGELQQRQSDELAAAKAKVERLDAECTRKATEIHDLKARIAELEHEISHRETLCQAMSRKLATANKDNADLERRLGEIRWRANHIANNATHQGKSFHQVASEIEKLAQPRPVEEGGGE